MAGTAEAPAGSEARSLIDRLIEALTRTTSLPQTDVAVLARAVLERIRDESVTELADRLDKAVEELANARDHAAQVEGVRGPDDPHEILKVLPEQYHEWFLADYRAALRAAYPTGGFLALTNMLHKWRLRAEKYADPAYQENLEQVRIARARHTRPPGMLSAEEVHQRLRAHGRLA